MSVGLPLQHESAALHVTGAALPASATAKRPEGSTLGVRPELAGRAFEGAIDRLSPVVDAGSGTFRVVCAFKGGENLSPGMFGFSPRPFGFSPRPFGCNAFFSRRDQYPSERE